MKFNKEMIGKRVFAIPTGNNARRVGPDKVCEFLVSSVGRIYVGLQWVDGVRTGAEEMYCPETGQTQKAIRSGYRGNEGYLFFPSLDDLTAYREKIKAVNRLECLLTGSTAWVRKLTAEQINMVSELIEGARRA